MILVTADGTAPGRTDAATGAVEEDHPPEFADLLPQLGGQDSDHRFTKQRWAAFHDTGLSERHHHLGVTQVVLAGVATSIGVESTARAAYDHGLHVTIAADAVTDVDAAAHQNSLTRVFPRMAEVGTTNDILAQLADLREPDAYRT
jgi:nicotinamidase-related amidase